MRRNTTLGLLGILGIWLTAGLALPFVNVLKMFTTPQLMIFRGFITAAMTFVVLRGDIWRVDKYTYLAALTMPFATFGLFKGIRTWGAGPTIVIITATPLVNLVIGAFLGRRITRATVTGLTLMLSGVVMARWGGTFQWVGFLWAVFGTIANGILYEFFARAKAELLKICFWVCVGMGMGGFALSTHASWEPIANREILILVVGFAFVGGFIYWMSNLLAFKHLPTNEASVLAQGEAPAVILGAMFLLEEHFTLIQWAGVAMALYGAWYLKRLLKKQTQ